MTISTAGLGGEQNGLGIPMANPLYGPGNAAAMASSAWNQNMQQAQATTQNLQAQTNRDIQTLAPDIAQKQASTALTQSQTTAQDFNNKVNDAFGVEGSADEKRAALAKQQLDVGNQRRNQEQQALMLIGPKLDGLPADQQDAMIADWFKQQGLPVDHAAQWGQVVRSHESNPPPDAGPASAAQPRGGGTETSQTLFKLMNPDLVKEEMVQKGLSSRQTEQLSMEEKLTRIKGDIEKDVTQLRGEQDPKTASQIFTNKYYQLKESDPQAADEYRRQAIDAMNKQGFYDASANFARNAYNPLTPLLQNISQNASGKPPQPAPQATNAVGPPVAPGAPQPPMPGGAPQAPQPSMPGAPQPPQIGQPQQQQPQYPSDHAMTEQEIQQRAQQAVGQVQPEQYPAAVQHLQQQIQQTYQQANALPKDSPQRTQLLNRMNVMQRSMENIQDRIPPQQGEVRKGWRFKGGAPGDKNNWEQVSK